ncbi:MAG: L-asparaginase [Carnobacterium sp.]|uniref:asparaginase n=1 Tax=Carnobacterium inhibens subsp. gilichinskyi TaxID=1266845 RepID=U5SDT0_9LACT|nr:asparaginase [Carnobacterium inhibens]AGY82258.1 asparaginase [Carnobacterium inhibens subsp. gilichinskyi]MDN5372079.1 L-asparaginase [Carnobacterium sp.]
MIFFVLIGGFNVKTILVLHTGGTISMSEDQTTGKVSPTSENPLKKRGHLFDNVANMIVEDFFHLPSPHMTPDKMLILKNRIEQAIAAHEADGVVITHGTDTLEETAYFLDLTLETSIPIVVTGAMRSINEVGSDGLYNFQSAIWVALAEEAKEKGVLVVMNDEIHTARYVTKTHTSNVATFRTPTFGPIGLISKNKVLFFQKLIEEEIYSINTVNKKVYLLKVYAGMDGTLFDAVNQPTTDGLVIEALGAGNLPPATLPALKRVLANNIPVVLVSRSFNGIAQDVYDYMGGGKQLKEDGVIFATGLSGPKARIKLQVVLSQATLTRSLEDYF